MHTPGTEERSGGQDAEHGLQDSWLVDWIDRTCYDFAEDDCVSRPKTRVLTATVVRCPFVLHALFEAAAREKWNVSAARALASMPVCTRDRQAPMHRSDPRVTLPSATIYSRHPLALAKGAHVRAFHCPWNFGSAKGSCGERPVAMPCKSAHAAPRGSSCAGHPAEGAVTGVHCPVGHMARAALHRPWPCRARCGRRTRSMVCGGFHKQ